MRDLKDYVKLYGKRGLQFEPGAQWAYSNYVFILLGVVVEKVPDRVITTTFATTSSNQPAWAPPIRFPEGTPVSSGSVGYIRAAEYSDAPTSWNLSRRWLLHGGGSVAFLQCSAWPQTVERGIYRTGHHGDNVQNGVRWFGHGGGAPGMNGDLKIYPGSGYVIAALSNLDPAAAGRISNYIAERLPI